MAFVRNDRALIHTEEEEEAQRSQRDRAGRDRLGELKGRLDLFRARPRSAVKTASVAARWRLRAIVRVTRSLEIFSEPRGLQPRASVRLPFSHPILSLYSLRMFARPTLAAVRLSL